APTARADHGEFRQVGRHARTVAHSAVQAEPKRPWNPLRADAVVFPPPVSAKSQRLRTGLAPGGSGAKLCVPLLGPVLRHACQLRSRIVRPGFCRAQVEVTRVALASIKRIADVARFQRDRQSGTLAADRVIVLAALTTERERKQDPRPIIRDVLLRV